MEENKNSKPMVLISVLVHLLLFGVTFYISFKAFEFAGLSSKFSYHPTFMAIGVSLKQNCLLMSVLLLSFFLVFNPYDQCNYVYGWKQCVHNELYKK